MDTILNWLQALVPAEFDAALLIRAGVVVAAGILIFALIGRIFFGKRSVINHSVCSVIGILFIYIITVVLYSTGVKLELPMPSLPLVSLSGDYLYIFNFLEADFPQICEQLLSTVILAFLVNLAESWLPTGKKLLSWYLYRCLTVIIAIVFHMIANALINAFLPADFLSFAPMILLGILVLTMLVGGLKFLVGAALATVNPIVGFLYTFFFASVIGKHLSKAVLTTVLISLIVLAMNYFGVFSVYIAAAALTAYIPLLIVLILAWYVVGHLF